MGKETKTSLKQRLLLKDSEYKIRSKFEDKKKIVLYLINQYLFIIFIQKILYNWRNAMAISPVNVPKNHSLLLVSTTDHPFWFGKWQKK